jgi:hypothetical protein
MPPKDGNNQFPSTNNQIITKISMAETQVWVI